MNKLIEKVKKVLAHNQFMTIAVVVVIALSVWLVGCESTTQSPLQPEKKVTRPVLIAEIEMFKVKVDQAVADLDRQDLFKQELFNLGLAVAQGGTINPIGAGVTLLSILGIGAVADNRKKDSIIKTLKNGNKENA